MDMTVEVIFRKFKDTDEVIALMPYLIADSVGNITGYMKGGQHGAYDYDIVMQKTVPASVQEHEELLQELEGMGYIVIPRAKADKDKMQRVRMNVIMGI